MTPLKHRLVYALTVITIFIVIGIPWLNFSTSKTVNHGPVDELYVLLAWPILLSLVAPVIYKSIVRQPLNSLGFVHYVLWALATGLILGVTFVLFVILFFPH